MAVTIVQKSQVLKKRNPSVALVLSGGAISGGAFKIGGLIALDVLFSNISVSDFNIYMGISAGSFLAAPLAAGIPPQELLRSFAGTSKQYGSFNAWDFYWPNFSEVASKSKDVVTEAASLYPAAMWSMARLLSKSGPLALASFKALFRKGSHDHRDLLALPRKEAALLAEQLPSLGSFLPSGLFDNSSIERYLRRNLQRARVPNNFTLLELERGKKLYIHAVDLDTARNVVFGPDERNDVTISEAVQASTALPGFYRPALINGRYYIDGTAKQTAPLDLAMAKGADLIVCYNPFRPFSHTPKKSLSAKYSSMGQMGLPKIIDQSIRTLVHSRLSLAVEELKNDTSFQGDLVVVEPAESDADFFAISPLSFWKRATAAKHGFTTVARDVERNFARLQQIFTRYGVETDVSHLDFVAQKLAEASTEEEILSVLASPPVPPSWQKRSARQQ